jgi:hypothetical protein
MSELRLNIVDGRESISGIIHGCIADAAVAALSAEPETIGELQDAMARFIKSKNGIRPFSPFDAGNCADPFDAGIIVIDLSARVVASEASFPEVYPEGEIQFVNGEHATDIWLPYRLPGDWLFLKSIPEYEGVRDARKAGRAAAAPFDARPVLYGAVLEFIVRQCLEARESSAEDPIAGIHARWLLTPRADLRGKAPRELMFEKLDFMDSDLWSREHEWTRFREPPTSLSKDSAAYRNAGFGRHEVVVYYDLIRLLLAECWNRIKAGDDIAIAREVERLRQIGDAWLEEPIPDFGNRTPSFIIECERRRLPLIMSPEESMMDDDCPVCSAMEKNTGPSFWHLDGSNMDFEYPFSFYCTEEDWEETEESRREPGADFNRQWEKGESENPAGEGPNPGSDWIN